MELNAGVRLAVPPFVLLVPLVALKDDVGAVVKTVGDGAGAKAAVRKNAAGGRMDSLSEASSCSRRSVHRRSSCLRSCMSGRGGEGEGYVFVLYVMGKKKGALERFVLIVTGAGIIEMWNVSCGRYSNREGNSSRVVKVVNRFLDYSQE